jgi:hypothetical protein
MMKNIITILTLLLFSTGCASNIPKQVKRQHAKYDMTGFMTFTFIGIPTGFTSETYLSLDGECKGLDVKIEDVIIGSYSETNIQFGISVTSPYTLNFGEEYYMTAGWGNHGMILFAETEK